MGQMTNSNALRLNLSQGWNTTFGSNWTQYEGLKELLTISRKYYEKIKNYMFFMQKRGWFIKYIYVFMKANYSFKVNVGLYPENIIRRLILRKFRPYHKSYRK